MRLLLVEDSSRLRRSLALGLRKAGYTVDDTGDGHEGQWKAESGKYDLIILDIMLPTVNGFRATIHTRIACHCPKSVRNFSGQREYQHRGTANQRWNHNL